MKNKKFLYACFMFTCALFLLNSCQEGDIDLKKKKKSSQEVQQSDNVQLLTVDPGCKLIDFDTHTPSLSAGDIISEVFSTDGTGPVKVEGINPRPKIATNAAMIFDTNNPTGGDPDLGTPNETFGGPGKGNGGESGQPYQNNVTLNNVLIVSEDLDQGDPDDEGSFKGAQLVFDFSELYNTYNNVSIQFIDILDVEDNETGEDAFVELLDKDDNVIEKIQLPAVGDNGYARVNFAFVPFVYKMIVEFQGSGAVDNIAFCPTKAGCTFTQGYYKNIKKHLDDWCGVAPSDDFFLSGHDYLTALTESSAGGNGYYILSQQYVAAVNNVCNGASAPQEVVDALDAAKDLFEQYTPAQIGALQGDDPLRQTFVDLSKTLDDYNNGRIGPGHCDD